MTDRPAWYGGNKIPSSYLKRFLPSQGKHEDFPQELRSFLNYIGDDYAKEPHQTRAAAV